MGTVCLAPPAFFYFRQPMASHPRLDCGINFAQGISSTGFLAVQLNNVGVLFVGISDFGISTSSGVDPLDPLGTEQRQESIP